MLQNIRDRLTGPFVWFIVGLIVIPFAFFGIETFRTGGADPTVATLGDCAVWQLGLGTRCQKITQQQFRTAYQQQLQQVQAMMGENYRPELIPPAFRQTVLDNMIQDAMLRQHTVSEGYRASDAMLFETLQAIPAFQENGKFSTEAYKTALASKGLTPARFELTLRDGIVVDQMRQGLLESGFAVPEGAAQDYRLAQQKRALSYATFAVARYLPQAQVSSSDVQKRYEQNKAQYQAPERIKVAYVELALADLPPAPAPAADYLRSVYEAEKAARFSTVEERHARHILVSFGGDKAAARKKIEAIADQIAKGADFAQLAASQSDDPGSKNKGGDLGWIRHGQMLEKFEKALFSLKKGEVSDPVETEFGWHLIKLEDVHEARTKPFDDPQVQAELLRLYRERDAEHRFREMSEKLEQTAFESPGSLEPAAQAVGLKVQTSDWFTRSDGAGIAASANVREAAFSEDVLQAGENSRPLPAGDNRVVVIHKQAYEAPRPLALDEVADRIREELKTEQARARAEADAKAALDAVAAGRALDAVAREKKADLKSPGPVARNANGIDAKILEALFKLPRPQPGKASAVQVTLANGDVVVVATGTVQDADWAAAPDGDKGREAGTLRAALAGAEYAAYTEDLKKRMDVTIVRPPQADEEPAS